MKDKLMAEVMQQMLPYLDNAQLKQLRLVMKHTLFHYDISDSTAKPEEDDSETLVASLRDALLPKLISGEIDVPSLDI